MFLPFFPTARRDYKKGIDAIEGRRRRDNHVVQLRKNKKEEGMMKRRAMTTTAEVNSLATIDATNTSDVNNTTEKKMYTKIDLPGLMQIFATESTNNSRILEAVRGIRKMLSVEVNPPVNEVIDCGALPILVELLKKVDSNDILFEAAWALTNVASTDKTRNVVDSGAVPHLINLLLCKGADVRKQSAWCLGNIAGDSPDLRTYVLECGGMGPL